jgi:murein DD-endopeptidase MepM/ murein hydrolase activator NlpD
VARLSVLGVAGVVLIASLLPAACADRSPVRSADERDSRDIVLAVDGQSIDGRVPPDSTLELLLRRQNLPTEAVGSILASIAGVFDPRELRAHQAYRVTRTLDGIFREFRYQIDADRTLFVNAAPAAGTFKAQVITQPREFVVEAIAVEIGRGGSLVGGLEARGENVTLALDLANIFGGEVDFNSDLQPGDRMEVLFERAIRNGEFAGYGRIKAATLENEGRRIQAILFEDADGRPAYYDEHGRSLKRQFLKSPLPFDPQVTSRFSTHRVHPVHGDVRAHLGVDYHAPAGTAVKTVASGVVDFAGMQGEAGRMVRVRHSGGYQTAYLHLSAIAPGIHVGSRVAQGDLIGKVGSSGTTTGPHLDYRIIRNGVYVDPQAELKRMPKGEPIATSQRAAFEQVRDEQLKQMTTSLALAATKAPAANPGK